MKYALIPVLKELNDYIESVSLGDADEEQFVYELGFSLYQADNAALKLLFKLYQANK